MSREAVEHLMDLWINNPTFRSTLRINPTEAVRRSGVDLDEDEWAALHSVNWDLSDDQLQEDLTIRINFG